MTTEKFRRCDAVTAKWEGGNVDHPKDPGGRTSRGVTQRTYNAYRSRRGRSARDVYHMSEDERHEIYLSGYWTPMRGEGLPDGVDLVAYDAAVNSGPARSAKWLQLAINDAANQQLVTVDGAMGPMTEAATKRVSASSLVEAACHRRRSFLQSLRIFSTFGRGWMRRVADIEARGVAWAVAARGLNTSAYLGGRSDVAKKQAKQERASAAGAGGGGAAFGVAGTAGEFPIEAIGVVMVLLLLAAGAFYLKSKHNRMREEAFAAVAKEISHV